MTWRTHLTFGIASLWLLAPIPTQSLGYDIGSLAACAVLGALLPDLDASESKVKHLKLANTTIKPFLLPAKIIHRTDQHRGLLHSLIGFGMVGLICLPLIPLLSWSPITALLLGYAGHLLADSATKSGIMLFYPRRFRFYLLPKRWRITTGSQIEEVLFVISSGCSLILLLRALI